MAMMISWVKPVNPSHPYLENDPAPSFDPHHLRISPWLWFRCIIGRDCTPKFCDSNVAWPGGVPRRPESAYLGFAKCVIRGNRDRRLEP